MAFIRLAALLLVAAVITRTSDALCGSPSTYPLGTTTTVAVQRPEGERYFIIYVPTTYDQSRPTALQFLFHGLNDNCNDFINETSFIPFAESSKYIIVAPCGSIGLLGVAWNSGTCCGFSDEEHPNDFEFARQMVQIISNETCIDPNKVAATGFSNGAFMSEVLACEAPDIFRAAVSVSGIVELRPGNAAAISRCTANISQISSKRPSVLLIHGDLDFVVPWTGDALLGFPTVPDNCDGWVQRNQCGGQPATTLNITDYSNQVWSGCTSGWNGQQSEGTVQLVRHYGGGHEWPEDQFDTTGYIHQWLQGVFGGF